MILYLILIISIVNNEWQTVLDKNGLRACIHVYVHIWVANIFCVGNIFLYYMHAYLTHICMHA